MANNPILFRPSDSDLTIIEFLRSYLDGLSDRPSNNADVIRYALSCALLDVNDQFKKGV